MTGLTNGTAYTFTVKATNSKGTSAASSASNSVTPVAPVTVPGAPTIGIATGGNAQATVTFTAPASNGGATIIGYTVTSSPAGGVDSNAGTTGLSHVITGLTNGTTYTFTVKATNSAGAGTASTASNSVTPVAPVTVPGAPTIGTATGGNAQATVKFTAPASNGGATITGYTVTSSPAAGVDSNAGTTGLSHIMTGLSNGTAYSFTVKATNSVGAGAASSASNSVTPATVPSAPTIGTATAGNAQATVKFTAPASNGGATITGYTVTSSPAGGVDSNAGTTGISHVITGLTNGTAYTFTVKATNAAGSGTASAASNSVTPVALVTVPGAPTIGTATGGNAQATVTFTAPASNGGATITGYTVISSPVGGVDSNAGTTGLNHAITGLTNGTAYTFTVKATNSAGAGAASAASNSATPSAPPTVSMTSPVTNAMAIAPASFTLTASAASVGSTIVKVDFYNGATLLGTVTTAPYSFTWGSVPIGTYSLTAVATDAKSVQTTSTAILATVNNATLQTYYIHADQLDTPREITDTNGTLVWQWDNNDPFGVNAPNENPSGVGAFSFNLKFPGQYFDRETSTHYNVNRDYDPATGRYTQSDLIGLAGGVNTYAYVGDNPLSWIDPLGLLTSEAQAIVNAAMAGSSGNTFQAYANILNQRSSNPTDPSMAQAEHYLFARDWTSSTNGLAAISLTPAIPIYTAAKTIADLTGNLAADTSKPSFNEIGAGFQGIFDGIKDALGIKPNGANQCH
jgi:RHS repeat-associated protein